jgi:hypothetical protein
MTAGRMLFSNSFSAGVKISFSLFRFWFCIHIFFYLVKLKFLKLKMFKAALNDSKPVTLF